MCVCVSDTVLLHLVSVRENDSVNAWVYANVYVDSEYFNTRPLKIELFSTSVCLCAQGFV